jgi:hypothetical protein
MKYVQAGILGCLMIIAGLLFGIYRGQQSQRAEPQPAGAVPSIALVGAAPTQALQRVEERPAPTTQAKPSPLPSKKPAKRTAAGDKPKASPERPAAASQAEPPPASEPDETFEAEPAPPPVTEPVLPNLPPLVDMPQPVPPPQQQLVTVPEGAEIVIRLINTLSTNRNLPGDSFEATLEQPLHVDGWLVAPKGSRVEGRVLESKPAGRVKGVAELSFDLVRLTTADGQKVDISTSAFGQTADKSRGGDLKKIGWGAGIGAVIGAIAGGGKGAAIGAGAGAGAGAGTVLATRGNTAVVPTETRLTFRLSQPLEVTSTKPVTL